MGKLDQPKSAKEKPAKKESPAKREPFQSEVAESVAQDKTSYNAINEDREMDRYEKTLLVLGLLGFERPKAEEILTDETNPYCGAAVDLFGNIPENGFLVDIEKSYKDKERFLTLTDNKGVFVGTPIEAHLVVMWKDRVYPILKKAVEKHGYKYEDLEKAVWDACLNLKKTVYFMPWIISCSKMEPFNLVLEENAVEELLEIKNNKQDLSATFNEELAETSSIAQHSDISKFSDSKHRLEKLMKKVSLKNPYVKLLHDSFISDFSPDIDKILAEIDGSSNGTARGRAFLLYEELPALKTRFRNEFFQLYDKAENSGNQKNMAALSGYWTMFGNYYDVVIGYAEHFRESDFLEDE